MKKTTRIFKQFLMVFMALLIMALPMDLLASAEPDPGSIEQPLDPSVRTEGDSEFFLANPDLYISDDYNPEKEYEEEKANAALQLAREQDPDYPYPSPVISGEGMSTFAAGPPIVGDQMVFLTQRWLNQEYGHVSGFGTVEENGKTGWDVIYGLTRAMQIELGITGLANNFGPTTASLYGQNPLQRQNGVQNKKFAILQCALWCKGYNPGYNIYYNQSTGVVSFDMYFDYDVEDAVIRLKKDIGFTNPNGIVTTNVMRALLSMDAFQLLGSYYGGRAEVRTMQQKFNRQYESYFETDTRIGGLIPCDGVFGRKTNLALIYAFQATEGLPVGTATGNFAATTRSLAPQIPYTASGSSAKSYQGNYYTTTQISTFIELLQFGLFLNGFGKGNYTGNFDKDTIDSLSAFQRHYALSVTQKVKLDDWMSLFQSSGNPDRSAPAADCATILNAAKAQILYDNGYRYIGRYLTGTYGGGINKALSVTEANIILNTGLRFFPIYQSGQYSASADPEIAKTYFTVAQAEYDANAAITAARNLGILSDTIIYFAVDFDAQNHHVDSHILPYFQKVNQIVSQSNYKTGIYGTRNICSRVAAAGYTVSSFVAGMSNAWSGNMGFKIPDNWAFSQITEYTIGTSPNSFGVDKNAFSGRDHGVAKLNTPRTKAIYVLPGYMGSKLYTQDDTQFFIEGEDMDHTLVKLANIPLLADIAKNAIFRKSSVAMLNSDGSGSKLRVYQGEDMYGSTNVFEPLVTTLTAELGSSYTVEFFPYNWLGDLNDSVKLLEADIKAKAYTDIVFVTHSTGGLLASAYIAKYNKNTNIHKPKVEKAILVAAPLFGTYASLMPLETGSGALIGEPYKIVDLTIQGVKQANNHYLLGTPLRELLQAITNVYTAANHWVMDVTHNSPTTYQLLPSAEYLKLMPQLYASDFSNAITSVNDYYNVLNGSDNINPNLTNGNNRSHRYFRETVLGGDIVKTLRGVKTVLIASETAPEKTETIARYESKLFGGTRLKNVVFKPEGDGTIHYKSATANLKENDPNIKIIKKRGLGHTELIKDSVVIQNICEEIKETVVEAETSPMLFALASSSEDAGMSDMIKIDFSCDTVIGASIFDDSQNEVAHISADDYFGFDGRDFIYRSYADQPDISDATIYMPNNGYKLVFSYGNSAGTSVDFNAEISTLDYDGWKDVSATTSIAQTSANGIIKAIDGTINTIDNTNIASVVNGTVQNHFTDWEIPDTMKLDKYDVQSVDISGSQAVQVSALLQWTSSDEAVATVSSSGVITAVGFGKATISATDGNKVVACEVTVMQNVTAVNFGNVNMFLGERKVVNPTFAPVSATETNVIYTYETGGGVISVDEEGVIQALSAGTVTVTGTTENGIANTFVVTVVDPDFIRRTGDVNGDEKVDLVDLVRMKKHIVGTDILAGENFMAADINKDGYVTAADLVLLKKILLEID